MMALAKSQIMCWSCYAKVTIQGLVSVVALTDRAACGSRKLAVDSARGHMAITSSRTRVINWLSDCQFYKFRQFLYTYIHGENRPQNTYGLHPAFTVVGAQVFGVDLRSHLRFIGIDIDDVARYPNQKFAEVLNAMDLNPVINAYQTGYVIDGEVFETARPWRVRLRVTTQFDFKTNTRPREGQGVFEIKDLIPGRGRWEKVGDGL